MPARRTRSAPGAAGAAIVSYALMPNHVHFLMIPSSEDGRRATFAEAHRRYTARIHARERWTGHLWQGHRAKGLIFLVALSLMFAIGIGIEGRCRLRRHAACQSRQRLTAGQRFSTACPAASQARIPPASTSTGSPVAAASFSPAIAERLPERQ